MATVFTIEGMDALANSVGFAPPVADGLVGWFHLDNATQALRNRASGGAAAVVAGTPVFSTGFASFATSSDRLDTTILDSDAITLLAVAKSAAAFTSTSTRPNFVGTYASQSGGIAGASLQVTGTPSAAPAATVAITASRNNGSGVPIQTPASITVADFSAWTFLAGIVEAGAVTDGRKIIDMTNGVTGVATPATARLRNTISGNSGEVSIGNMSSLVAGAVDLAWAAIYHRALTVAEVAKIYAFVQRRLADKFSISI
jgi:hypothetical protein